MDTIKVCIKDIVASRELYICNIVHYEVLLMPSMELQWNHKLALVILHNWFFRWQWLLRITIATKLLSKNNHLSKHVQLKREHKRIVHTVEGRILWGGLLSLRKTFVLINHHKGTWLNTIMILWILRSP